MGITREKGAAYSLSTHRKSSGEDRERIRPFTPCVVIDAGEGERAGIQYDRGWLIIRRENGMREAGYVTMGTRDRCRLGAPTKRKKQYGQEGTSMHNSLSLK